MHRQVEIEEQLKRENSSMIPGKIRSANMRPLGRTQNLPSLSLLQANQRYT